MKPIQTKTLVHKHNQSLLELCQKPSSKVTLNGVCIMYMLVCVYSFHTHKNISYMPMQDNRNATFWKSGREITT